MKRHICWEIRDFLVSSLDTITRAQSSGALPSATRPTSTGLTASWGDALNKTETETRNKTRNRNPKPKPETETRNRNPKPKPETETETRARAPIPERRLVLPAPRRCGVREVFDHFSKSCWPSKYHLGILKQSKRIRNQARARNLWNFIVKS